MNSCNRRAEKENSFSFNYFNLLNELVIDNGIRLEVERLCGWARQQEAMKNDFQLSTLLLDQTATLFAAIKIIRTWQSENVILFSRLTFHWRIVFLTRSFRTSSKLNQLKFDASSFKSRTRRLSIQVNRCLRLWTRKWSSSSDPIINPIPMAACWDFYKLIRLEICNYLHLPSSPNVSGCCSSRPSFVYKCVKIISFFEKNKKCELGRMMIMIIKKTVEGSWSWVIYYWFSNFFTWVLNFIHRKFLLDCENWKINRMRISVDFAKKFPICRFCMIW